ncbi:unnamed protein product [Amoebophrya sp. A25]|nr:unnamed protein product [Amoebophrya sp. A25]|eukprot:GSA25T00013818001.1
MSSLFGALTDTVNVFLGNGRAQADGSDPIITRSDIVKEGWLSKESRNVREWRRRYVVLTNDCLATFRSGPEEMYRWSDATELVMFGQMMTVRSADHETGKENSFCMQRQKDGKYFYFLADSASEKESWVGAVGRAMVRRTVMIDGNNGRDDDEETDYADEAPIASPQARGSSVYGGFAHDSGSTSFNPNDDHQYGHGATGDYGNSGHIAHVDPTQSYRSSGYASSDAPVVATRREDFRYPPGSSGTRDVYAADDLPDI